MGYKKGYSHGFVWTDKNKKILRDMWNLGLTRTEIVQRTGLTYGQISNAIQGFCGPQPMKEVELTMGDLKSLPPVEKLLEHLNASEELIREFDPRQRECSPQIKTKKKWIGVIFHGDWHFDHYKTELVRVIKDLEILGKEEDVFYIFNGDAGDWSDLRFKGYNLPSIIFPIQLRYEIACHLIKKIKNLLAVVAGCHDDWVKNRGFFDIIAELQKERKRWGHPTYYLGYGGFINLSINKQTYRMGVYHKFRGESKINDFLPCVNFLRDIDGSCDIVSVAHRHDKSGISFTYYQHIPRILIRTGSNQYLTDYAWKEGFAGAINRTPMVLLSSTEKRMTACPSYQEGIEELRRLNHAKS